MARNFEGQEYSAATNNKGLKASTRKARWMTRLSVTFSVFVMLVSVGMIAFCAIFILSPVDGKSMMTTLNATGANTDSAIACRVATPERGDIVICKLYYHHTKDVIERYPNQDSQGNFMYVIKRLIAKGGDQIKLSRVPKVDGLSDAEIAELAEDEFNYYLYLKEKGSDSWVKVNEARYLDPIVAHPSSKNFIQLWRVLHKESTASTKHWVATRDQFHTMIQDGVLTVPEGYQFLMGDNRGGNTDLYDYSWDSCYLGPQPASDLVGVCVDIVHDQQSLPAYLWDKIVYYVTFGWLK